MYPVAGGLHSCHRVAMNVVVEVDTLHGRKPKLATDQQGLLARTSGSTRLNVHVRTYYTYNKHIKKNLLQYCQFKHTFSLIT